MQWPTAHCTNYLARRTEIEASVADHAGSSNGHKMYLKMW